MINDPVRTDTRSDDSVCCKAIPKIEEHFGDLLKCLFWRQWRRKATSFDQVTVHVADGTPRRLDLDLCAKSYPRRLKLQTPARTPTGRALRTALPHELVFNQRGYYAR